MDDSFGKDCSECGVGERGVEGKQQWVILFQNAIIPDTIGHYAAVPGAVFLACAVWVTNLKDFNKQLQPLVLNKMAAGCGWFIGEVPERAQCKFQGRIHHTLSSLLTYYVEELLWG